ncbi:TonB-dependent receptor [Comamonas sp. B-9]|uniref:TonB-dependent siderophore receptor n=1 Tax=Comamonas sp. B-9 TaxID=1055192 RepID=UPI000395BFB2|nr:TonB-dependent receptor [Comamonas sp. B-9]
MPQPRFQLAPLALATVLALPLLALSALPAHAQASAAMPISVPAQPLGTALNELARQARLQLMVHPDLVAGKQAPAVAGNLTARQALDRVLQGSGLVAEVRGAEVIVKKAPTADPRDAATLSTVTVTAQSDASGVTEGTGAYTTHQVRTATKMDLSIRETPQSVSVVTQQQMRDANMQSLDDVTDALPGVTYSKLGTERSYFYSRGFQITDLQIDGLSTSMAESFSADAMSLNNMAIYDRVEVVRGANGLLQGSGNPSAVINLVRKRPTREFQMSAELGAGSWADYRAQLDVSGPLNAAGSLRGRAVVFDNQANSFKQGAEADNRMLYAIVEADLGSATTASLGFSAQRDNHQGYDWGGFNTRADGTFYDLDRSASLSGAGAHLNRDNYSVFGDIKHRLGNGWSLTAAFNAVRSDASFVANYPARVSDTGQTLSWVDAEYQDKQVAFDLHATGPYTLFGREHQLMLSLSRRRDNFDYDIFAAQGSQTIDISSFDFSSIRVPGFSSTPTTYALERNEKGAAVATRLRATDALSFIIGSRLSWSDYASRSPYTNASFDSGRQVIPYAGAVYDLSAAHALYASYTDIYSIQQYYSPNGLLAPVKGKNYEVGMKSQFFDGRLQTAVALFQTDQLNLPVALNMASTCGLTGATRCYTEGAKVRNRGVDLEVSGSPTPGWNLAAGFTYSDPKYVAGPNDGLPYNTTLPRRIFKVSTDYRLPGGKWRLGGNVQAQSAMSYSGSGYRIQQGGYALLNLHAAYQFNNHLRLQLNVRNALDKHYYQSIPTNNNYGGVFVGTPRSFAMTLRYDY